MSLSRFAPLGVRRHRARQAAAQRLHAAVVEALEDRTFLSTTLISVDDTGAAANGGGILLNGQGSTNFSPDGRFVLFTSTAANLVPGVTDTNNADDVFLRDRVAGTTSVVSVDANGNALGMAGNANFQSFVFSPDSKWLLFRTRAANIVPALADTNNSEDWFVRNLLTGVTKGVSVNSSDTSTGNATSFTDQPPTFSPDGKLVAFGSIASDLVAGVTDTGGRDYFVRNLDTDTTQCISIGTDGKASGNTSDAAPKFSADGRYVVFISSAGNLDPNVTDTNEGPDLYVRDLQTNTTRLITRSLNNTAAAFGGDYRIAPNGQYVVFDSSGQSLVAGVTDLNNTFGEDYFTYNLSTGAIGLVTSTPDGKSTGDKGSTLLDISKDSRFIAFSSASSNLTPQSDYDPLADLFVRDLVTGVTSFVSRNVSASAAWGMAKFSPDNTHLLFDTFQSNVIPGVADTNAQPDLFLYNDFSGVKTPVTINAAGTAMVTDPSEQNHTDVLISPDGRYISFVSDAPDLVPNFTSQSTQDLFVRDTVANTTTLVTQYINGGGAGYASSSTADAMFTPDSKFLVFPDGAPLADGITTPFNLNFNGAEIYAFDLTAKADKLISVNAAGTAPSTGAVVQGMLVGNPAADEVLFVSNAADLVNGSSDVTSNQPSADDVFIATVPNSTQPVLAPRVAVTGGASSTIVNNEFTPSAADGTAFGNTNVGVPLDHTFIISNTGTAAMTTGNLTVPNGFSIVDGLSAVIQPGQNDAITIRFNAAVAGIASGAVTFTTNDATASTFSFNISGTAAASQPIPLPPTDPNGPDLSIVGGISKVKAGNFIGGTKGGKASVKVQNTAPTAASGMVQVKFFASLDQTLDLGDTLLATVTKKLNLKQGKSKTISAKFNYPANVADGSYFILADADAGNALTERNESNNVASSPAAIGIAAPFVDLSGSGLAGSGAFKSGKKGKASMTLSNGGNEKAAGSATVQLFASADEVFGNGDDVLIATVQVKLSLKPNKSKKLKFKPNLAGLAAGSYRLFASIDSGHTVTESNEGNNTVTSAARITVV